MRTSFTLQPVPTADAAMRLERLSATTASTTWHDITVNNKNGTANSATLYSDFQFNGTNTEVETTLEAPVTDSSKPWTLQAWVTRSATGFAEMFEVRSGNAGWVLRDNPTGGAAEEFDFATFPFNNNINALPSLLGGAWYHLAIVWTPNSPVDSKGNLNGYVDGELYATRTPDSYPAAGNLIVGDGPASGGNHYNGKIDTVRVYSRALSADEILRDYYAGQPAHP